MEISLFTGRNLMAFGGLLTGLAGLFVSLNSLKVAKTRRFSMTIDERKSLGKQIKNFRTARNLTQSEFAKKIGYKPNTVAKFETGERTPTIDGLRKIANALHFNVTDFIIFEQCTKCW